MLYTRNVNITIRGKETFNTINIDGNSLQSCKPWFQFININIIILRNHVPPLIVKKRYFSLFNSKITRKFFERNNVKLTILYRLDYQIYRSLVLFYYFISYSPIVSHGLGAKLVYKSPFSRLWNHDIRFDR